MKTPDPILEEIRKARDEHARRIRGTVYRLVAADTIEVKIVQLHHTQRDLAGSFLEGTDTAHTLTADQRIDLRRAAGGTTEDGAILTTAPICSRME